MQQKSVQRDTAYNGQNARWNSSLKDIFRESMVRTGDISNFIIMSR